MQPISEKMEIQFRGPSSSGELNKWADNIYYDLVQLFNASAQHKKEIDSNLEMLVVENIMLQKKIKELEAIYDDLEATIAEQQTTQNKVLTKLFTSSDDLIMENMDWNSDFNVLMLKTKKTSRLYLKNASGTNLVPSQLKCRLYEDIEELSLTDIDNSKEVEMEVEDLLNIVDGDPCSFFLRKSKHNSNEVYFCLEIDLPANIITHQRLNAISIIPTPMGSITLTGIYYQSQLADDWIMIPSYPLVEEGGKLKPGEISNLGKELFYFPSRDALGIRIYGKQDNWFEEGGDHIFYYGFRSIEADYLNLLSDTDEEETNARVKFAIPDPQQQFVTINKVVPVFAEGGIKPVSTGDQENYIRVNYIYVGDQRYGVGDILPLGTKEIEVDFTVFPVNEISPLLIGLKIEYQS